MKFHKSLYAIAIVATVSSACKSLDVKDVSVINDYPQQEVVNDSTAYNLTNLKVATYFKDPNLLSLYEKAIANNPDFKIAQQRVLIANGFLKNAKMQQLPSLEIGALASGNRYGNYTIDGVGNYDTNLSPNISEDQKVNRDFTPNYWLGAQSTWEVDVWGKLKNKKVATQRKFLSSQEGVKMLQTELLTSVASLYYELVALDLELGIYQENYQLQQRAFEIIEAQRAVGKATELAVQQFKGQNKKMEAAVAQIELKIIETEKALRTLVGSYDTTITRSDKFLTQSVEILNRNLPVAEILNNRPDVMAEFYNLQASHADAKAARAALYPSISLEGSIGYNAFSTETLFRPSSLATQLLAGVMMPIFNRGQIKQQFNIAKSEQEIAFLNYQKTITTAFNELQAIVKQIEVMEKVLKLKKEEVYHMNLATEVSHDLYLTGYANYLELINTRKDKLQSDLELLQLEVEKSKYNTLLFKALGGKLN